MTPEILRSNVGNPQIIQDISEVISLSTEIDIKSQDSDKLMFGISSEKDFNYFIDLNP